MIGVQFTVSSRIQGERKKNLKTQSLNIKCFIAIANFATQKIKIKKLCKICYPLSFAILGKQSLTRSLQSTPLQSPGRDLPEHDGGAGAGKQFYFLTRRLLTAIKYLRNILLSISNIGHNLPTDSNCGVKGNTSWDWGTLKSQLCWRYHAMVQPHFLSTGNDRFLLPFLCSSQCAVSTMMQCAVQSSSVQCSIVQCSSLWCSL